MPRGRHASPGVRYRDPPLALWQQDPDIGEHPGPKALPRVRQLGPNPETAVADPDPGIHRDNLTAETLVWIGLNLDLDRLTLAHPGDVAIPRASVVPVHSERPPSS